MELLDGDVERLASRSIHRDERVLVTDDQEARLLLRDDVVRSGIVDDGVNVLIRLPLLEEAVIQLVLEQALAVTRSARLGPLLEPRDGRLGESVRSEQVVDEVETSGRVECFDVGFDLCEVHLHVIVVRGTLWPCVGVSGDAVTPNWRSEDDAHVLRHASVTGEVVTRTITVLRRQGLLAVLALLERSAPGLLRLLSRFVEAQVEIG